IRTSMTDRLSHSHRTVLSLLLLLVGLRVEAACAANPPGAAQSAAAHPAQPLIDRAVIEVRTDPEASKRDAEGALALLQRQPDADLEIRARLLLCDYQSERDPVAAQKQIDASRALLPQATRKGLAAGILN